MKKLILLFLIIIALLAGCKQQDVPQIVATTLPVYEFTAALCEGTDIAVSRLVSENVSCLHDYSLQVSQLRAIEDAQVVVLSGAGLEDFLTDVISKADCVIDASEKVTLSDGHNHEGHSHEHDPHIWLSPENAKQMCTTICAELSAIYPSFSTQFETNLAGLLSQLDDLQAYGDNTLKDLKCKELITFHDGFAYFAESYDLHILKAVEEESGSEASAKELTELIDIVNSRKLPAIFTEVNGSTSAAQIVSTETGVKIYTLDMAMSGDSYFSAMYHNIDTIKEALG